MSPVAWKRESNWYRANLIVQKDKPPLDKEVSIDSVYTAL